MAGEQHTVHGILLSQPCSMQEQSSKSSQAAKQTQHDMGKCILMCIPAQPKYSHSFHSLISHPTQHWTPSTERSSQLSPLPLDVHARPRRAQWHWQAWVLAAGCTHSVTPCSRAQAALKQHTGTCHSQCRSHAAGHSSALFYTPSHRRFTHPSDDVPCQHGSAERQRSAAHRRVALQGTKRAGFDLSFQMKSSLVRSSKIKESCVKFLSDSAFLSAVLP